MKLVEYDIDKIEGARNYRRTSNLIILEEFIDSGMECAKVEGFNNKTATHCTTSLNASIKRFNLGGIRAISRKGGCYLIKIDK